MTQDDTYKAIRINIPKGLINGIPDLGDQDRLAHRWKEVKDDPKIMAEIRNIHEINNGGKV